MSEGLSGNHSEHSLLIQCLDPSEGDRPRNPAAKLALTLWAGSNLVLRVVSVGTVKSS